MKANELLIRHLEAEGIRYIFGVPGAPLMPIYHAMAAPRSKIKPIISKHEEGGAFMADGYARISGKIGVCCGTAGPGTTNLITGIAGSLKDSIPILVLTAQVATSTFGKGALQECTGEDGSFSASEFLKSVTKSSVMIFSHENLSFIIKKLLRNALNPRRGPVHLNLPPDVLRREVPETEGLLESYKIDLAYFDRNKVREAVKALLNARRPVILLGYGSILSGAAREVIEIAEILAIPVATTPKAKGAFPEDHPLSLGVFGLAGTPAAPKMILVKGNSDLLFSIGMSFDEWGTNGWDPNLKGEKILIQIDFDPNQIGKNYPVNIGLVGDAKTVLREFWFELHREIKRTRYVTERSITDVTEFKEKFAHFPGWKKMNESDAVPIKPQRLMHDLRKALPRDAIFFVDSGNHTLWAIQNLPIYEPGSFVLAIGLGAMGYSIGGAIGGKLAAPDRPVVSICGDGCFFMHGMEVATAVNYNIPVIFVVFNDSRLNMIYQGEALQKKPGVENYEFKPVDIAMVARGLGAEGIRIEQPDEIIPAVKTALLSNKPTVLDVIIDREELSPIKERILAIQKFMKS